MHLLQFSHLRLRLRAGNVPRQCRLLRERRLGVVASFLRIYTDHRVRAEAAEKLPRCGLQIVLWEALQMLVQLVLESFQEAAIDTLTNSTLSRNEKTSGFVQYLHCCQAVKAKREYYLHNIRETSTIEAKNQQNNAKRGNFSGLHKQQSSFKKNHKGYPQTQFKFHFYGQTLLRLKLPRQSRFVKEFRKFSHPIMPRTWRVNTLK